MVEWIDEDANHMLNNANGETYSSFSQLQHKIMQNCMIKRVVEQKKLWHLQIRDKKCWYTGGSHLNWIFWEHENLSSLSVFQIISTNLH